MPAELLEGQDRHKLLAASVGGGASRFSWPTSTPRRYWLSSPLPRHRPPSDTLNGPAITAAALARIDADVDDLLPS